MFFATDFRKQVTTLSDLKQIITLLKFGHCDKVRGVY